jgi:thiol-disulfide isomerase/thioredoxin
MMKRILSLLCAVLLLLCLGATAFADAGEPNLKVGDVMPDFTVSLTDGTTATLSELLKEKELVVLNFFASWCVPCEKEFPDMEKVYQANSDRMVILSLSAYEDDTMDVIADYKASHGLSFPMGLSGSELAATVGVPGYPTTLFIDRSGKVGFVKVGAFQAEGDFEAKVSHFLAPNYDGLGLQAEIVRSHTMEIFGALAGSGLLLVIARWALFRKAGKPGWHSLIPVLNVCQEYSLCWSGLAGLLALACPAAYVAINVLTNAGMLPSGAVMTAVKVALAALFVILRIVESMKLAKVFGKKAGTGILLLIFANLGRLFLGLGKAKYVGKAA